MKTIASALCVTAACGAAHAQVAYTSLGPANTYGLAFWDNYVSGLIDDEVAWQFTPQLSGNLTQLRMPLFRGPSGLSVRLAVYSSVANTPAQALWSMTTAVPFGAFPSPPWSLAVPDGPVLQAGIPYFFSVAAVNHVNWRWYSSDQPIQTVQAQRLGTAPWQVWPLPTPIPAIEISVPTPASAVFALVAAGATRRRRRSRRLP